MIFMRKCPAALVFSHNSYENRIFLCKFASAKTTGFLCPDVVGGVFCDLYLKFCVYDYKEKSGCCIDASVDLCGFSRS